MDNLYREDLAGMSPEAIVEAYRAGRFDAALRGERRPKSEPSTMDDSERSGQWPPPGAPRPERR